MLIMTALAMPAAAEAPPVTPEPARPAVAAGDIQAATDSQLAVAADTDKEVREVAVAMERPVRVGKVHYSPIGEAVLNLLRSQGGGHLRP